MQKDRLINGIIERLTNNFELKPSEVYVLLDYVKQLQEENQQLKEQLEISEKAREEAIDYINFLVIIDTQSAGGRFKDTIWGKELSEILDIDKGE